MAETKGIFLTRHIGKTTYKVRVRNDGLAIDGECGIMELPQMSRQSERSA